MSTSVAVAQAGFGTAGLDRAVLILYLASLALLPWAWFPPFPWLHEHAQWGDPVFAAAAGLWTIARLRDSRWRLGMIALWIAVGLTFSRGIIGFGVAELIRHARTRRRRILAAACAAVGIGVMVLLTFCKLSLDPARPLEAHLSGPTLSSRYHALTTSLESIVKNPFFGAGPDSHPARYGGNPFDSHMTYAGIAATLGLPALAAFSLIICIAWLGRRRPTELSLWGAMAGLAIDGLGQNIESFRHLWVLIGLSLADAGSSGQGFRAEWSGVSGPPVLVPLGTAEGSPGLHSWECIEGDRLSAVGTAESPRLDTNPTAPQADIHTVSETRG